LRKSRQQNTTENNGPDNAGFSIEKAKTVNEPKPLQMETVREGKIR